MSSRFLFTQGNEQNYATSFVNAETMNITTTVLKLCWYLTHYQMERYSIAAGGGGARGQKKKEN